MSTPVAGEVARLLAGIHFCCANRATIQLRVLDPAIKKLEADLHETLPQGMLIQPILALITWLQDLIVAEKNRLQETLETTKGLYLHCYDHLM